MSDWLLALMLTAATVGALHSLGPDHWLPFAALSRARNWSPMRTARLAILCGAGHVTVSAILGVLAVVVGREAVEGFGTSLHDSAPLLLIGFGFAYLLWALWRIFGRELLHRADHLGGVPHDHGHGRHHHHDHGRPVTEWGLFVLFCCDPCIALIPMIVAASAGAWGAIGSVVLVYELATIAAIVVLVQTASAGARKVRFAWIDRYGDAVAGALIILLGAVVTVLGI
jgi:ABC-type nickel/cobalt efflux system permease component RcnA